MILLQRPVSVKPLFFIVIVFSKGDDRPVL